MARVASMKGAPRIAPTPTPCAESPPEPAKTIATIGIIVSGSAVPTAASTLPTAPSARFSLCPNHSMPLVKSSDPPRITTSPIARMPRSMTSFMDEGYVARARAIAGGRTRTPGQGGGAAAGASRAKVLRRVRQKRNVSGTLQRHGQLALMLGAGAGLAARLDLGSLRQVSAEPVDFLVVDLGRLVGAE